VAGELDIGKTVEFLVVLTIDKSVVG